MPCVPRVLGLAREAAAESGAHLVRTTVSGGAGVPIIANLMDSAAPGGGRSAGFERVFSPAAIALAVA
jgi:hypothetical protein